MSVKIIFIFSLTCPSGILSLRERRNNELGLSVLPLLGKERD
jgi:hypothetical protein